MAEPHGHATIDWIGNLLQVKPFGPFNEEGLASVLTQMQDITLANAKNGTYWQRLDILHQETLGSPKVMRMIGHSYLWCFSQGCQAIATVYSTQIQKAILLDFIEETQTNMKGFDNRQDADNWLKEQCSLSVDKTSSLNKA
jgi:hypothetical protein